MVSIVIPYYNRSKTIRRTLLSIVNQTYSDFEVIIVDDCSSDSEKLTEIVSLINDNRFRVIRHNLNKNGSSARNTGIRAAKGRFLALLDSDDTWCETKLENDISILSGNDNVVIYGSVNWIHDDGTKKSKILPLRGKLPNESVSDYLFSSHGLMQTSTLFMPIEIARDVLFNESLKRHQDYGFVLDLEAKGYRFIYSGVSLTNWHVLHSDSVANKGASLDVSAVFLNEYKDRITRNAKVGFVLNELLYVAVKNKEFLKYIKMTYQTVSFLDIPLLVIATLKKICFELNRKKCESYTVTR